MKNLFCILLMLVAPDLSSGQPLEFQPLPAILAPTPSDRETIWSKWIAETNDYRSEVASFDGSRVDVLSPDFAVEVEWALKWKEAIGQAILYSIHFDRPGAVILLSKTGSAKEQECGLQCKLVCERLGIPMLHVDTRNPDKELISKFLRKRPQGSPTEAGDNWRQIPSPKPLRRLRQSQRGSLTVPIAKARGVTQEGE